jgi:hypothetical protein
MILGTVCRVATWQAKRTRYRDFPYGRALPGSARLIGEHVMPTPVWYSTDEGGEKCVDLEKCFKVLTGVKDPTHPTGIRPDTIQTYYLTPDDDGMLWIGGTTYFGVHPMRIARERYFVGSSRRRYHFGSQLDSRLLAAVCSRLVSNRVAWKSTRAIVVWMGA